MASSAKRRKQLARERWERQQERRAQRDVRRKRLSIVVGVIVTAAAVTGGGLLVANAIKDDTGSAADASSESPSDPADSGPVDPAACEYRDTGDPAVEGIGLPREMKPDDVLPSTANLTINDAEVTVDLVPEAAPCTVRSLAFLAENDYFDNTECHRLTTGANLRVLQCGDPTGTGSGSPGYEFDNENTDGATYPAGTVAMANSGANTNGSQFFLVYDDSQLQPDFTVFGQISGGIDALKDIAQDGVKGGGEDGEPATKATVKEVTTS